MTANDRPERQRLPVRLDESPCRRRPPLGDAPVLTMPETYVDQLREAGWQLCDW